MYISVLQYTDIVVYSDNEIWDSYTIHIEYSGKDKDITLNNIYEYIAALPCIFAYLQHDFEYEKKQTP